MKSRISESSVERMLIIHALQHALGLTVRNPRDRLLKTAFNMLHLTAPRDVRSWAMVCDTTERSMRRAFARNGLPTPRELLGVVKVARTISRAATSGVSFSRASRGIWSSPFVFSNRLKELTGYRIITYPDRSWSHVIDAYMERRADGLIGEESHEVSRDILAAVCAVPAESNASPRTVGAG